MLELATSPPWLPEVNRRFATAAPEALLRWGLERFSPGIALATSFGPQTIVLMHMVARLDARTTVFYLDTDLLFEETYALRDRLATRLGLAFTRVHGGLDLDQQAAAHGPELWARDPAQCCHLRKVLPLRAFLAGRPAWIAGVRRRHSATREQAQRVEWDEGNGLIKLNPLVDWTAEQVWEYLRVYELPYNRLHLAGYPSVGCRPCTVQVGGGEDARSGRWAGSERTECGIHGYGRSRPQGAP